MNGILHWRSFYRKKTWRIYYLRTHCPANTNLNLIRSTTVSHFWPPTTSFLTLFHLWWCYCVLEYRNNESKSKQHVGFYLRWMKHLLKYFFLINETNIYTTAWRWRCGQLHRLARLNTRVRRYISWRQIWYVCLTVVICLRFRNVEIIKYLRKIGICIPKYTA